MLGPGTSRASGGLHLAKVALATMAATIGGDVLKKVWRSRCPQSPLKRSPCRACLIPVPSWSTARWSQSPQLPPAWKGRPWHPHRGFETVTYMIDGILRHQDSNGGGGLITDGDTQWMTAGSGLIH